MKEIFSAFASEVFRPLVTIFIPGSIALCSWIVFLVQQFRSVMILAVYLLCFEARESHRLLSETRHELMRGIADDVKPSLLYR